MAHRSVTASALLVALFLMGCSTPEPPVSSVSIPSPAAPNPQAPAMRLNLSDYQWQSRLLLIFAPDQEASDYQQQMENFAGAQAGLSDRNLLLIELLADGSSQMNGEKVNPEDAETVRSRFGIESEEFAVLLIGKDGTLKRQDSEPVSPAVIFSEIDAMPMRQREMQQ